jgi:hypothetical protein
VNDNGTLVDVFFNNSANNSVVNSYYTNTLSNTNEHLFGSMVTDANKDSSSTMNLLTRDGVCVEDIALQTLEDCLLGGFFWLEWEVNSDLSILQPIVP